MINTTGPRILLGDMFLLCDDDLLGKAVRLFETMPGKKPALAGHYGQGSTANRKGGDTLIEALNRVVRTDFSDYTKDPKQHFVVIYWKPLTTDKAYLMDNYLVSRLNAPYGYLEDAACLGDNLLSRICGKTITFFRKLNGSPHFVICSKLGALAWEIIRCWFFDADPDTVEPQMILDYCLSRPSEFGIRYCTPALLETICKYYPAINKEATV